MSSIADYFKSREDPHKAFFDSLEFPAYLSSFTAMDRYFDLPCGMYLNTVTTASLVELARAFDELEFPGLPGMDAAVRLRGVETPSGASGQDGGNGIPRHAGGRGSAGPVDDGPEKTLLVSCQLEEGTLAVPLPETGGPFGTFLYSPSARRFYDPAGIYPVLRAKAPLTPSLLGLDSASSWEPWLDAAVMLSRYPLKLKADIVETMTPVDQGTALAAERAADKIAEKVFSSASDISSAPGSAGDPFDDEFGGEMEEHAALDYLFPVSASIHFPLVGPFRQREVLIRILESRNPQKGLELLRRCGFIESHWPELYRMIQVRQGKEFHPEGDVWEHSLATFSYRKSADLVISLALLLHDSGKPEAEEFEGNKFHRHAQIGGRIASRFLRRLGFMPMVIEPVNFLIANHMVPGITRTLPPFRVQEVISSSLYPMLLEVYRCDLSSTFRGPEGYYEACKVYRSFLKHLRNPYRDSEGKKRMRMYVEG